MSQSLHVELFHLDSVCHLLQIPPGTVKTLAFPHGVPIKGVKGKMLDLQKTVIRQATLGEGDLEDNARLLKADC